MSDLAKRYQAILKQIQDYAQEFDRSPDEVNLVAVSKTKPAQMIREMADLGQLDFGENYLQEALEKQRQLSDLNLVWHFIGHIQSNKTKDIAQNFDWVHGVDRLKIAKRLNDQASDDKAPLNICLQVNLDLEESKSGATLSQLQDLALGVSELPNIKLRGLMAIPSPRDSFESQCEVFLRLRQAMAQLNQLDLGLDVLSMGMTNDMRAAICAGATHVRIGTALFGARNYT